MALEAGQRKSARAIRVAVTLKVEDAENGAHERTRVNGCRTREAIGRNSWVLARIRDEAERSTQ